MGDQALLERITNNPAVMAGKPVIRSTRVPVELFVRMVAQGISFDEILQEYPRWNVRTFKLHCCMQPFLSPMKRYLPSHAPA